MASVASSERVAGIGFLLIILLQVPYFVVRTPATQTGIATLAPLQVFCAKLAYTYPATQKYAEMALIPGAWTSFSLLPYIRCMAKSGLQGPCNRQAQRLWDPSWAYKQANLRLLVDTISGKEFREGKWIEYGSALIVVSALFSVLYSVKTAVVGFALIGYGLYLGKHDPLPPFILSGFLCVYAGFQLGETKERLRQRQAKKLQSSNSNVAENGSKQPSGKASSSATPGKKRSSKKTK